MNTSPPTPIDPPQDLAGRVALITGASAGIGRATAIELATRGARVVINARRADRLQDVAETINALCERDAVVACPGDAADASVIEACLTRAPDQFCAEADLVVVNAGRGLRGGVLDSDTEEWEAVVRTNLLGAARLMRAAGARLSDNASREDWPGTPRDIIVLGSTVGRHISPFSSMYGSTKFGVGSLAEALRRELGPMGVRVTLIEPAVVRSEFQDVAGYDPKTFGEFMAKIGPVLEPEDVARSIAFVAAQPAAVHINDLVIRPTRQDYP